jgi:YD repeat-containing protein
VRAYRGRPSISIGLLIPQDRKPRLSILFKKLPIAALTLSLVWAPLITVAAETVTYTYDTVGRLIKADYGVGKTIEYTYDRAGNLLTTRTSIPENTLRVHISPEGGGSASGDGIACPPDCVEPYPGAPDVTLAASPGASFTFLGWGGDATGTSNPINVTMGADKNVIAYFGAVNGMTDADGVPDTAEMGPGGNDAFYDGDGNGVPDYQEARAASFPTFSGGGYATLAVPQGLSLSGVQAVGNPSPSDMPSRWGFPYGFFQFTTNGLSSGGCTKATLYLPLYPGLTKYFKYGPTPDNASPHWYEFTYESATTTGVVITHEATRTRIDLHLCDGKRGDDDLTADGLLADQGGPAVQQYALQVQRTGTGSGSVTAPAGGIDCGSDCTEIYDVSTVVNLVAAADPGSRFAGWSGGGCTGTAGCGVTVDADKTVAAEFRLAHTITVNAGAGGWISPPGPTVVLDAGTTQAFAIGPQTGYHLVDVLVDGVSMGPVTSYTFSSVSADHSIAATFAIDMFTVAVIPGPHGKIEPPGPLTLAYGTHQSFEIVPDPGFHVVDVIVDGASQGPATHYDLTVSGNHAIRAYFSSGTGTIDLARTGQTVSRAPGDDGDVKPGIEWPAPRFTAGTGTQADCVTDELTGLMWVKAPMAQLRSWPNALAHANGLTLCGKGDWRLPNINELESLLHAGMTSTAAWLNGQGFAGVQDGVYWSSTTYAGMLVNAWVADFSDGSLEDRDKNAGTAYAWPVRGTTAVPGKLWKTGQADIYYDQDDGHLQRGEAWPQPRFTVGTGAGTDCVTDHLTGLLWVKAPGATARSWQAALTHVGTLGLCGFGDWRLPSRKELRSLIHYAYAEDIFSAQGPAAWLNGQGFTGLISGDYWTSTGYAPTPDTAWTVSFKTGKQVERSGTSQLYTLAVRSGAYTAPDIAADPPSLEFGPINVGSSSASKPTVISNEGNGPLSITTTGITGGQPPDFEISADGCTGETLDPGESCQVSVFFRPSSAGPKNAALTLLSDDPDTPSLAVALQGEGVEAQYRIDPADGTVGTEVTITGEDLGSKGKVLIGDAAVKILEWVADHIKGLLSKVPPVGTHEVVIQPKKAAEISGKMTFDVKAPALTSVEADPGFSGGLILRGSHFTTKKGKVALDGQTCKVREWVMDPGTGLSYARITVPKKFSGWEANHVFTLSNKVGTAEKDFFVPAP